MARHRSPGGQAPSPALEDALDGAVKRVGGSHRLPAPSSALRGRVVVAAVAAGAFAAAAAGQTLHKDSSPDTNTGVTPLANASNASASMGIGGNAPASAPELLPTARTTNATAEAQKLTDSQQVTHARVDREAEDARKAAEEAARPKTYAPAKGTYSSGFGARWGASHLGIDVAGPLDTDIVAVSDGTIIDAGPASGFGLWIRVKLDDGTIHVYGHMNKLDPGTTVGKRVKAGERIAGIGNNGQSTGPHVHFEVWEGGGKKIDPAPWLAARGVNLGSVQG